MANPDPTIRISDRITDLEGEDTSVEGRLTALEARVAALEADESGSGSEE